VPQLRRLLLLALGGVEQLQILAVQLHLLQLHLLQLAVLLCSLQPHKG
jgi:hypothetical protein